MSANFIWALYEKSVAEAIAQRHYSKASNILKEALYDAKLKAHLDPKLMKRAKELASVHFRNGDFNHSASIYRMILDVQQSALGSEHPDTNNTLLSLCQVLGEAGGISPNTYASAS